MSPRKKGYDFWRMMRKVSAAVSLTCHTQPNKLCADQSLKQ
jgi:hypothetical protein